MTNSKAKINRVKMLGLLHELEEEFGSVAYAPAVSLEKLQRAVGCATKDIVQFRETDRNRQNALWAPKFRKVPKEKEQKYKPGDTVTDGWSTYTFDYELKLHYISSGNHAMYKITKNELKALRGQILGNYEIV